MKDSEGLPVGVQIAALPWQDEKCLAAMKELESVVDFHQLPKNMSAVMNFSLSSEALLQANR